MDIILEAQNLKKTYGSGRMAVPAVNDISLSVFRGEFVCIIGQSGSGKTTLLKLLSGLLLPDSGTVRSLGQNITEMKDGRRAAFRRENVGFVFQKYSLLPEMTNRENIALPSLLCGKNLSEKRLEEIRALLDIAKILDKYPSDCSGGEQQRIAIARAFANRAELVFADEPTGNLDCEHGENTVALFRKMQRLYATTVVMVTHNLELASLSDRILTLRDGKIIGEKGADR